MQIDYSTVVDSRTVRGRAGFHKYSVKLDNIISEVSKDFFDTLEKYGLLLKLNCVWVSEYHTNYWKVDKENTCLRKRGKEAKISFMLDASQVHTVDLSEWEKKYKSIFSKAFWYAASVMKFTDLEKLKAILSEFDPGFEPVIYSGSAQTDDSIDIEVIFNNVESWASDSDLDIRDEIRDEISEQLVKSEIGEWTWDSFGENTNEIGFNVNDEESAKQIIINTLKKFNIQEFTIEIL